jgi:ParB family chromosome partitioning protein
MKSRILALLFREKQMAKQNNRLGKGLSALVRRPAAHTDSSTPGTEPVSAEVASSTETNSDRAYFVDGSPKSLPISQIRVNRQQPRTTFAEQALDELTASVKRHGIMQPLVVRPAGNDGQYELIAGERRLRAARQAGLAEVPVTLRECSDQESLELALIENLQREDLNPLERAEAYRKYLDDTGSTTDELAERLGQSRPNVANHLRLLNLADEVQQMVAAGELQMGHARALLSVDSPERQISLARQVVRRQLSARQVEALVAEHPRSTMTTTETSTTQRHMQSLEDNLSRSLGIKVNIVTGRKKNAGRIILHYSDLTQFDKIAEKLGLSQLPE